MRINERHGGKRIGSGRKSKAEELGLASLLEKSFGIEKRQAVIENLTNIAIGADARAAVSAASLLLGYAFGKPTEKHEHSGDAGGPLVLKVIYESDSVE